MPVKGEGEWQISEYWTPMVPYTLWLMAELSANRNKLSIEINTVNKEEAIPIAKDIKENEEKINQQEQNGFSTGAVKTFLSI